MKREPFKRHIIYSFLVFFILVAFVSCTDNWKKTTGVTFHFDLAPGNSYLNFTSGSMYMTKVSFSGSRQQGSNVSFENTLASNLSFQASSVPNGLSYDIPQGTYNSIQMSFETSVIGSNNPNIILNGTYLNSQHVSIPVQFQFNAGNHFPATVQNSTGGNQIVLVAGTPANAYVTFDPNYWFGLISPTMLDSAHISCLSSGNTIVISEESNDNLFNLISGRVAQSVKVVFK